MGAADWPVDVVPPFNCWVWTGKIDRRDGRPLKWLGARPVSAQRYVYEREVGPVPEGLEIDHTCRNTACVAPHHAEPVTRSENELRKSARYRARIKTCRAGHDLRLHGMMTPQGGRACRKCSRDGV